MIDSVILLDAERSILKLFPIDRSVLIAIDGRCGSGKSTLAAELSERLKCCVVQMDDFFLPPEQRTLERLAEPGGNVDYERFLSEVLLPLTEGRPVRYRPYVCLRGTLGDEIALNETPYIIVEGSYSLHPRLRKHYDWSAFLTTGPEKQRKRILARSGPEKIADFETKWIPLEELYINSCRPDLFSNSVYET